MTYESGIDTPVHEQQVTPVLVHDRLALRAVPDGEAICMSWLSSNHQRLMGIFGHESNFDAT